MCSVDSHNDGQAHMQLALNDRLFLERSLLYFPPAEISILVLLWPICVVIFSAVRVSIHELAGHQWSDLSYLALYTMTPADGGPSNRLMYERRRLSFKHVMTSVYIANSYPIVQGFRKLYYIYTLLGKFEMILGAPQGLHLLARVKCGYKERLSLWRTRPVLNYTGAHLLMLV